ncbi:MAG: DUF393 domain-containing protein [Bacteroidales bacterium]|nr:DUF393 domain-containing protein [Bacteroidales bacterium]
MEPTPPFSGIVFFDSDCILCNRTLWFIIKNLSDTDIGFASLQGETARYYLASQGIDPLTSDGVIYLKDGKVYKKSKAIFMIGGKLKYPWKLLKILNIIPAVISNCVYNIISKHRYRWFGKRLQCIVPPRTLKGHFLK